MLTVDAHQHQRTIDIHPLLCISTSFWVLRTTKSWSKHKINQKNNFEVPPQGVIQLLHVDQLLGVDKTTFFCSFSDVFCWFQPWNHWKRFEMNKKGWKTAEKMYRPAFGCAQIYTTVHTHQCCRSQFLLRFSTRPLSLYLFTNVRWVTCLTYSLLVHSTDSI